MSYIGVPPFGQTVRTVTELTATAGQTAFNISGGYLPGYIDVYLNGVSLVSADLTATDGTTVTLLTAAGASDEFKAIAYWPVSLTDTYRKGEVDSGFVAKTSATGAALLPAGTTAQRPASPTTGMLRQNTTTGYIEYYDVPTAQWVGIGAFQATGGTVTDVGGYRYHTFTSSGTFTVNSGTKNVDYLVVAGGGGGGGDTTQGGGGGAGGYISASTTVLTGPYSIIVGAGGAVANNGSNSSAFTSTAIGGGRGGIHSVSGQENGVSGGSGGGASMNYVTSTFTGGAGTSGQGNAGGNAPGPGDNPRNCGGGGGAGAAGATASGATVGVNRPDGGAGTTWLNGITYAGGGGGGDTTIDRTGAGYGLGGAGGGGNGARYSPSTAATSGGVNTGGGGGGRSNGGPNGAAGGSGIVIIRYTI